MRLWIQKKRQPLCDYSQSTIRERGYIAVSVLLFLGVLCLLWGGLLAEMFWLERAAFEEETIERLQYAAQSGLAIAAYQEAEGLFPDVSTVNFPNNNLWEDEFTFNNIAIHLRGYTPDARHIIVQAKAKDVKTDLSVTKESIYRKWKGTHWRFVGVRN